MASGDTLVSLFPRDYEPAPGKYATLDLRSTRPVLDFDAADPECANFTRIMPRQYGGSGVTVTIAWAATSATTGGVRWNVAFQRGQADTDDLDLDNFSSCQSVTATVSGTSGRYVYSAIPFTNGAQMASVAVGEVFRLHVAREVTNAGDDMSGDAELVGIEIRET